jgi:CRISPR-associated protein Csx10
MAAVQWSQSQAREVYGKGRDGLRPVDGDIPQGADFRLLLTSACIARKASTGQIDPAALTELIEGGLGGRAKLQRKRWAFEAVGGFNRKWRLELPQALAVSAGSVFVFNANQTIPVEDLYAIENEGFGERREEGYGRVLFLDAPLSEISLRKPEETAPGSAEDGQPPRLVLQIEEKIVWAQLVRKIEEVAASVVHSAQHPPNNSLIGRLRTPLRGKPEEAIETLKHWLKDGTEAEQLKRSAMDQLERCRMDGKRNLVDWILEATDPDKVLSWLHTDVLAQRCRIVSEESAKRILEDKTKEISAKLIDAVLAALAVRNKTEEAGDER